MSGFSDLLSDNMDAYTASMDHPSQPLISDTPAAQPAPIQPNQPMGSQSMPGEISEGGLRFDPSTGTTTDLRQNMQLNPNSALTFTPPIGTFQPTYNPADQTRAAAAQFVPSEAQLHEISQKIDKVADESKSDKRNTAILHAISDTQKQTTQNPPANELKLPAINMPQMQVPQFNPQVPQQRYAPPPQMMPMQPGMVYSDVNLKKNVSNTSLPDINEFVRTLVPKNFDYKDKENGTYTRGGVLAQDLQKSKIGKSVVVKTTKGLAIDTNKLSPILASVMSAKIANLEQKIDKALNTKFKRKNARS
jgi:hypothetical protein